jgi:hypothetical protein
MVLFVVQMCLGRPKNRWGDDIKMCLKEIGGAVDWIRLGMACCSEHGNALSCCINCGEFLD